MLYIFPLGISNDFAQILTLLHKGQKKTKFLKDIFITLIFMLYYFGNQYLLEYV